MTTERTTAAAATEDSVIDYDGVKFICDVRNVEDLLLVPNTKWVIGSGYNWEPESQTIYICSTSRMKPAPQCNLSRSRSGRTR